MLKHYDEFTKVLSSLSSYYLKRWGISEDKLNFVDFIQVLLSTDKPQDISVDPNSNVSAVNIARTKIEMLKPQLKYLTFAFLYDKMVDMYGVEKANDLLIKLLDGTFYLHDTSGFIAPYCLGVDMLPILLNGINWGTLQSRPPKRPSVFINQVKEVLIELAHEFLGAVAVPTLLILYTYIYLKTKKEQVKNYEDIKIDKKEVINDFQNFVHTVNRELRVSQEPPFTNISYFDRYMLDEIVSYIYAFMLNDFDKEFLIKKIMEVQEIVMEFMASGDPITGLPYKFPVNTANLSKDKEGNIRDKEFFELVCKYNTKGQMNIYVSEDVERFSFCCRYNSNFKQQKSLKFDSFGNGGVNTGSIHVCTINLNRIALMLKEMDGETLMEIDRKFPSSTKYAINRYNLELGNLMDDAVKILDAFRECLRDFINKGKFRFFNLKWFDLDKNFFSTIGFVGLYEAIETLNFSIDEMKEILKEMDNKIQYYNNLNKDWYYNLEQVPGESACILLCDLDKYKYGKDKVPYDIYANQFIPLYVEHNILDKIKIEGELFKYLSGGGISHINIAHELTPDEVGTLVKMAVKNGLEHFALNPCYSICENGHTSFGKNDKCPICQAKITDYLTRIVGYFTRVSTWNKGRRIYDFMNRCWNDFNIKK